MRKSNRGNVDPFIVMDVMENARKAEEKGEDIVHMEVGQPGTPAPIEAQRQLIEKMKNDSMGYTVALGIPELRKRISQLYGDWYNLDLNPDRIIITSGSSAGFILSFSSLFDAKDRVGICSPGYPSYRQILKAQDLETVLIETKFENNFQPFASDLKGLNLSGVLIASPANPTGSMLNYNQLESLILSSLEQNISFISDEIYHGIEYEKKATTALQITNQCYVINSFSKYFSMTGWRVGWMVVPEDHIRQIERLAQNMFICAPHASQIAALHALDCEDELKNNLDVYKENRKLMIKGLKDSGFSKISSPDGAFYIYADVSKFCNDSLEFANRVLKEAKVAITPGLDFDSKRGNSTIRFSYARSTEDIIKGLEKLNIFMKNNKYI
jgi:aspartate/methionine/tyrosine aminotransferase|tara:strand:- start:612 stop:1763 length:1152 start_codon:yes stop_codon:yes gene_type:complete